MTDWISYDAFRLPLGWLAIRRVYADGVARWRLVHRDRATVLTIPVGD